MQPSWGGLGFQSRPLPPPWPSSQRRLERDEEEAGQGTQPPQRPTQAPDTHLSCAWSSQEAPDDATSRASPRLTTAPRRCSRSPAGRGRVLRGTAEPGPPPPPPRPSGQLPGPPEPQGGRTARRSRARAQLPRGGRPSGDRRPAVQPPSAPVTASHSEPQRLHRFRELSRRGKAHPPGSRSSSGLTWKRPRAGVPVCRPARGLLTPRLHRCTSSPEPTVEAETGRAHGMCTDPREGPGEGRPLSHVVSGEPGPPGNPRELNTEARLQPEHRGCVDRRDERSGPGRDRVRGLGARRPTCGGGPPAGPRGTRRAAQGAAGAGSTGWPAGQLGPGPTPRAKAAPPACEQHASEGSTPDPAPGPRVPQVPGEPCTTQATRPQQLLPPGGLSRLQSPR